MSVAIAPQLAAVLEGFNKNAPEPVKRPINQSRTDIKASFDPKDAPQVGSTLPGFSLQNAIGETITLKDLLSQSETKGVLITFYRGGWCPFCNIALRGLQEHLEEFNAAGVSLVAISPELPDGTLTTKEKNQLKFEVLSDVGTRYAKQLGIMWQMPEYLTSTLTKFGHDFKTINGNDDYTLPIPTTILVDKEGKVRNIFAEPDYTERLEPATALEWVKGL